MKYAGLTISPIIRDGPDAEMRVALTLPSRGMSRSRLRWVLCHLIEETARHNGHVDMLREMADGVTGA